MSPQIQVALLLKVRQFQEETSLKCDLNLMTEVFEDIFWKESRPETLALAIDDIFSFSNQELILAFKELEDTPSLLLAYENS